MKRVFVGIKVSDDLAREIILWRKEQKTVTVRWTLKNNLHITLVPPWYEEDIDKIKRALSKMNLGMSTFEIYFQKISLGPSKYRPRLVWVQGPIPHELPILKRKIEGILGITPEKREFKFHITLGRFKEKDFPSLRNNVKTGDVFWKMKVESFHLFESKLSNTGAEYEVLKEIVLQ